MSSESKSHSSSDFDSEEAVRLPLVNHDNELAGHVTVGDQKWHRLYGPLTTTVVLRSSDGVHFRVPLSLLGYHSTVFADMRDAAEPTEDPIDVDITADGIASILSVLYASVSSSYQYTLDKQGRDCMKATTEFAMAFDCQTLLEPISEQVNTRLEMLKTLTFAANTERTLTQVVDILMWTPLALMHLPRIMEHLQPQWRVPVLDALLVDSRGSFFPPYFDEYPKINTSYDLVYNSLRARMLFN